MTKHISIAQFKEQIPGQRQNQANTGKSFEKLVADQCRLYDKQGVAVIEKVEPPTTVINGVPKFMNNPFLDFIGILIPNGYAPIPVMFECKSTSKPTLSIGKTSGLNQKQYAAMKRWSCAGCTVFLLWEYSGRIKRFNFSAIELCHETVDALDFNCVFGFEIKNMNFLKGLL